MKDIVGIGIIGTGFARRVQIPAFMACEGAQVVSVASGRPENARATAEEFEIPHWTDDWHETVARNDVDLVVITTPPVMHREMTLAAIAAGKHVLCEKPMAMNAAEAEEMAAAARPSGVLCLIDHELRFQPGRLLAHKLLREGAVGKVRHVKGIFRAPHRGDPDLPWDWWSDADSGGGALGAIGSHIIDTFHWLLGADIMSVTCQLHAHISMRLDIKGADRDVTTDDETLMMLRFADGELTRRATGLISVSMTEGPDYQNTIEIFGTDGVMRIGHLGDLSLARSGKGELAPVKVDLGSVVPGVVDTGFARAFHAFAPRLIDAIRSGNGAVENAADFDDGVRIQRVLDAARRSDATGSTVTLK